MNPIPQVPACARQASLVSLEQFPHGDDFILPRGEILNPSLSENLMWEGFAPVQIAVGLLALGYFNLLVCFALISLPVMRSQETAMHTLSPVRLMARDALHAALTLALTLIGFCAVPVGAVWMLATMQGVSPMAVLP